MKTRIIILAAIAVAASPAAAVTEASVTLYANLSPTRIPNVHGTVVGGVVPDYILQSPSFDTYSANVIAALEAGQTSRGGSIDTTPTAFNTLTRTTVNAGETFATPFHSWRGDLAPTGAFAGEYGTFLRLATKIVSPTAFTLADVVESDTDTPDLPTVFTSTFADQIKAYGLTAVGINYGADGKRGGGDDTVYDSAGLIRRRRRSTNSITSVRATSPSSRPKISTPAPTATAAASGRHSPITRRISSPPSRRSTSRRRSASRPAA